MMRLRWGVCFLEDNGIREGFGSTGRNASARDVADDDSKVGDREELEDGAECTTGH